MKTYFGSKPKKLRFLKKKTDSKKVLWSVGSKIRNPRGSLEKDKDGGLILK